MNYSKVSLFAKQASLWDKKIIFILCCSFALGKVSGQSQTFNYTGSLQSWTVPGCTSTVTIATAGAAGGTGAYGSGGLGAQITGTFTVTPGQVLDVLVGQQGIGTCCGPYYCGSGGGGTYVWNSASSSLPMIVAGGGGGSAWQSTSGAGSATQTPTPSVGGGSCVSGGSNGNGGASGGYSGSGAGWLSNGGNGSDANGGQDPGNGGAGGTYTYPGGTGGYGGGGGCSGNNGAGGGGGGYNGGGGGTVSNDWGAGGGGGSYNGGSNQTNTAGVQSGNGTVTITWVVAGSLSISGNVINDVLCNGGSSGKASAIITGGGSPFTYSWSPAGGSQDTASGLSAGNYTVSVHDACGNSASASVSITQPTALSVSASVVSNVTCNGGSNGKTSSSASGGTSPYTYSWSNGGGSNSNATGLSAGTYSIMVTDKDGCTGTASAAITQPTAIIVTVSASANVLCNGGSDGSASSNVSGGISPYTYIWSNLQNSPNATGLSAGSYTLGVSDANGCTATASVSITQPNVLNVSASVTANELCNGESNGSASSAASGGTGPYFYSWSNGGTSDTASGLSAGTYTVNITDNNGCTATASFSITQPNALSLSVNPTANMLCSGDSNGSASSVVSGGTGPYTYLWSNGGTADTATGLIAGAYSMGLTDANGCTVSAAVSITQPTAIMIVPNSQPDNGHGTGAAWVNVSGGTGPYNYLWNPGGNTTDSISKKDSGTYCCMVRDSNGCVDSVCIKIKSTLGIANIASGSGEISIYPNPNNGQFTIQSSVVSGRWSVEVYNVLGEKVYSTFNIPNPTFNINLGNQPDGVYLYRVISNDGDLIGEGKLIIQK